MRKLGKLLWIIVRSILILIVVGFTLTAVTKNIQVLVLVQNFKSQGVFQPDISTETVKYYKVESDSDVLGYTEYGGVRYPGYEGDILVTKEALVGGPIIRSFVSFTVGGHAGYCLNDYYDYILDRKLLPSEITSLEATGMDLSDTSSLVGGRDYWNTDSVYNEVIGLRVKMTEEDRKEMTSIMCSYIGDPYNYSFLFDTKNKSYCSDIISKGFAQKGYNLNKDGFITSIFDLIVSCDTEISYYHYFSNGIKYVYYYG